MENTSIADTVSRLLGQEPWDVRLGEGSFLTMEFGRPEANPAGDIVHGEWHLWLYMCMWRIETRDAVLAGSEDDSAATKKLLGDLPFGSVQAIDIVRPSLDLSIQFGSGVKLLTFSYTTRGEEQWKLFTPENIVLTVYGGGRFHCDRKDEPRHVIG
jgi:hypothetical protein